MTRAPWTRACDCADPDCGVDLDHHQAPGRIDCEYGHRNWVEVDGDGDPDGTPQMLYRVTVIDSPTPGDLAAAALDL